MRAILNISMPQKLKAEIEQAVEQGGYATKSEFLRDVLRVWKEQTVLARVQASRDQIKSGQGRVLTSLKDLR